MQPRGIQKMSLLKKLFARKALDGLLEISDRTYVLNCCRSSETPREEEHRESLSSIVIQLRNFYADASFMVLNFMEGDTRTTALDALPHFGITINDYPSRFQDCPLLPLSLIQHVHKSTERWLYFDRGRNNIVLLHSEKGALPLLAFILSSILVYKREASSENKVLETMYKRVSKEMMQLELELNPQASHLRYLQYVEKLRGLSDFREAQFVLDCVILRSIPNFDGVRGCRPAIQVFGTDPIDGRSKILFRSPMSKKQTKYYKQGERHTVIKLNTECPIQGDVLVECVHLPKDDLSCAETMFRFMFNTAFVQSNMVNFTRDELDVAWNAKDKLQEDFKIEVFFSDITISQPVTPTKEAIKDDNHDVQSIATEGTQYDEFFDTEEITVRESRSPMPSYLYKSKAEDVAVTESDIHVVQSSSRHEPDVVKSELNSMRFEMSDKYIVGTGSISEEERETTREVKRQSQKPVLSPKSKMPPPIRGTKKFSITPTKLTKPNLNVESKVAKMIHGERNLARSQSSPRASMQHAGSSPGRSPRTFHGTALTSSPSRRSSLDGSVPSFATPLAPQLPRVKVRVTDVRQKNPARSILASISRASPKASTLATSPRATSQRVTSPRSSHTVSLHDRKDVAKGSSALSRSFSSISTTGSRTPPHQSQLRNAVMSPRLASRSRAGTGSAITRISQQNDDGIRRTASMPRSMSVPKTRARAL